ncbi:ATP phosphoribosyltransferase regulatory subunit [Elioraea thermophila]|uniref:ATP phosphoribosyltransferase regulatory subunit n=1 Tax=Elioraea thermophila TaxID=2185104 RepID=UPI000DF3FC3C|nr:ATP phosphoribosyltransferase regulatory subunit [Elioraea thermophila]
MNDRALALLPPGLRDLLPPEAEIEAAAIEAMAAVFAAHGYERVKPPLLEFEESLLGGAGASTAEVAFRLMDPVSHRMLALRADITPQVARIAAVRLARAPRPLRLCYSGQVLRVRGTDLRGARQMSQAGIELIGSDCAEADAEVIAVAAEALAALGVPAVSFDLTLPTLVDELLAPLALAPAREQALRHAIDRKDAAEVAALAGPLADTLDELLHAAGPADRALEALAAANLPPAARALADRLAATVAAVRARDPAIRLTADPLEFRGFRYHRGVAFTIFSAAVADELGRGGAYRAGEEPATGVSLYPDAALAAAAPRPPRPRVFVPAGTPPAEAAALRQQGFATVLGLDPVADAVAEARRLGCSHVAVGASARPIEE